MSSEAWYRRSSHCEDTHFGWLDNAVAHAVVHARCGDFEPQVGLFGGAVVAVEVPMQHGQACQACCALVELAVEEVESPPPNYVRCDPQPGPWGTRTPGTTAASVRPHPALTALAARRLAQQQSTPPELPELPVAPPPPAAPPPAPPAALPTAPPPAPPPASNAVETRSSTKTSWMRERGGDIHWVTTIARGVKNTACGRSLRRGKWESNPSPDRICQTCDERRPR